MKPLNLFKTLHSSLKNLNHIKFFCLLLLAYCLLAFTNSTYATVRYVSHEGSNTPPYLTWETAADSIMSAINISEFGDTIYVANGVYEEQIVMIPGLTLIGAGMDSCIIDTRSLVQPTDFFAVTVNNDCVFLGFMIIVSNSNYGTGIFTNGGMSMIKHSKIKNSLIGIWTFNSNSEVFNNIVISADRGIVLDASTTGYHPIVYNNFIDVRGLEAAIGIQLFFGAGPTIKNNVIHLGGNFARGYSGSFTDTVKLYNNLVISETARYGFVNSILPALNIGNQFFGPFSRRAIDAESFNIIKNNNVINCINGIIQDEDETPIIQYNNSWNNALNYAGFNPDSTNLTVNPMIVNDDTTKGDLDFHLQKFSPLIDAGDPNILDVDSSRSDIGLYGGPYGERYVYLDLPPKPPRNLTAVIDSPYITVTWNKNTEADFNSYNLFRDTTADFTADSTTFVMNLTDTNYRQIIPPGVDAYYYKLTATDNQGNESEPSEELAVIITSVKEYPITVSSYQLYQNYPNPFNPSTKIGYKLKERGYVKLYVYDIKGELVDVLVNQFQDAGYYEVEFSGEVGSRQSAVGNRLSSGVYIYQIMVKNENNIPVFSDMKKMIYIK